MINDRVSYTQGLFAARDALQKELDEQTERLGAEWYDAITQGNRLAGIRQALRVVENLIANA